MAATLTPHEDAVTRIMDRTPPPDDPFHLAALNIVRTHQIECARMLDRGQDNRAVFALTTSIATSMIDSIASSAATGFTDKSGARQQFIDIMLERIQLALSGAMTPTSVSIENIDHGSEPGNA